MDNKIQFLFMLLSELAVFANAYNKYCYVQTCPNGTHTLCLYPQPIYGFRCGKVLRYGLNQEEKDAILDLHNLYRYVVYSGNETRGNPGPMPKAKAAFYLEWDYELEFAAQKWADQCQFTRDICRNFRRYLVGQSVGFERTVGEIEIIPVNLIVNKWYAEVERFSLYNILHYNQFYVERIKAEHFSQMIWADTRAIGCGSLRFDDNEYRILLLVCNYGPRGNLEWQPVYPTFFN